MGRRVNKQEKAAAIARAALHVFRDSGYHATRMADIATAAGVGKGTLYEYFADKGAILRFEFNRYFAAFESEARRALAGAEGPRGRLLALAGHALDHTREWEDHCAVYVDCVGAARAGHNPPLSLAGIYQQMRALLTMLIREGQAAGEVRQDYDVDATAELLLSIFDGLVLHSVIEGRKSDPSSLRVATLTLLERGLLTPERDGRG